MGHGTSAFAEAHRSLQSRAGCRITTARPGHGTAIPSGQVPPGFHTVIDPAKSPLRPCGPPVCTENLIRVDDVLESPKLAEWSGCSVSLWPSWPRHSSRSCGLKLRIRRLLQ